MTGARFRLIDLRQRDAIQATFGSLDPFYELERVLE
jgi:hypothetical protein